MSSSSLRYCAAHSCLLALLMLLASFSVSLWRASEQTRLYLNKTRFPAPFSDSELLSLTSATNNNNNQNNNNNNGNNNNGAAITIPISNGENEGIIVPDPDDLTGNRVNCSKISMGIGFLMFY